VTYRTTLTPQEFALAIGQLGFSYVETSCFATTYRRGNDLVSAEEPEHEVFEELEIATDFSFTADELAHLKARQL
jgi:hypothetical protein